MYYKIHLVLYMRDVINLVDEIDGEIHDSD